jgi:hypothetical protein
MSKPSLHQKVRRAYCQGELARICTLPEKEFGRSFGMKTVTIEAGHPVPKWRANGPGSDYYHFRDNGARVLAVAHLDTVVRPNRREPRFRITQNGPLVTCGALDDRLGAYVTLRLLPALGVTCDQLLTVGEESGQSTASSFTPEKKYDWVIEFDRAGTDVVMYQFDDAATRQLVRASGANVGTGSFSDIAYLEHLGVKAFNWGVGYRGNYHSEKGYAYLGDTFAMVAKYLRFHAQNAGKAMPHEEGRYSYGRGIMSLDNCDACGAFGSVDPDTRICDLCDCCADCTEQVNNCQCYYPRSRTASAAAAKEDDGDTALTWEEYLAKRLPLAAGKVAARQSGPAPAAPPLITKYLPTPK